MKPYIHSVQDRRMEGNDHKRRQAGHVMMTVGGGGSDNLAGVHTNEGSASCHVWIRDFSFLAGYSFDKQ